jgi:hypothetical protein
VSVLFSPDAEHCHNCGEAVGVVWTASDDLWAAVQGRPGGILCVQCFDDRAVSQGRFIRWVPQEERPHENA